MTKGIMLLGGGLQSISMARGLKDCGYRVVNCAQRNAVGKWSRYVDKFYVGEVEDLNPAMICGISKDTGSVLIIPMEDEYALWLSENRDEIERNGISTAVEDASKLKLVINKASLMEICGRCGVPVPKTLSISKYGVDAAATAVGFPSLLKPDISNGSRGIQRVEDIDQLKNKYSDVAREFGECTLQEFIENDFYYNVMLYRYEGGDYSTGVVTKITRYYPIKGGSSSFCTTVDNDRILNVCKKLLDCLDWKGFADFDVLEKDPGDYRIIEINPRVPASVHAAYASGVNFSDIIVSDLIDKKKILPLYSSGESLRYMGLDIAWFLASPDRFRCVPTWFKFFGKHLHYQDGGLKDIKAMAYSFYVGIRKQLSPTFRNKKAGMN